MADFDGWTLAEIQKAIDAGQPATLGTAAADFKFAYDKADSIPEEVVKMMNLVTGKNGTWTGPASRQFHSVVGKFVDYIVTSIEPVANYNAQLKYAETALTTAQEAITTYAGKVEAAKAALVPPQTLDENYINEQAREIIRDLAKAYETAVANMEPAPVSPKDIKHNDKEDPKEDKPKDEEPKEDKPKDEEPKEDKPKDEEPKEDKPKDEEPKEDKPKEEEPKTAETPKADETPKAETPKAEEIPKDASIPTPVPLTPKAPLSDKNRVLKDAPVVEKDGVKGLDVNGDGKPDIGLDGKPLPDAKLVTKDGVTGVDVNGDGKPDIGMDGEILKGAPIVEKDGVRGVDVNGDGKPDIGLSGQGLPDATIITKDGVRGYDVNGDGKPDIGLDRKPLEGIDKGLLVTRDGVKGVDVNGDGKPDVGMNGDILKDAPIVTHDGIKGLDVNEDKKPDIALTDKKAEAFTARGLGAPDGNLVRADGGGHDAQTRLAGLGRVDAPTADSSYKSNGIGGSYGGDGSPRTSLTSAAVPPGPSTPTPGSVSATAGVPASGARIGAPGMMSPMMMGMGGAGGSDDSSAATTKLVEDEDTWGDDGARGTSALGRPKARSSSA